MSIAALPLHAAAAGTAFDGLHHRRHRSIGLLPIAALHLAALWLFVQHDVVHRAVQQATPLVVALLSDSPVRPPAPLPQPPAPPRRPMPTPALAPPPVVTVAAEAPPAPPPTAAVSSVAPPAPALPVAVPVSADPAPLRALPAPSSAARAQPAPPVLPASAIRYRVPPPVEVPLASRRLRESGTVLLRVLVDAQGLPRQITLHKSSGFSRLDEQALAAMRQARFQVLDDNGNAIEWLVIAPLQYDVD